MILDLPVVADSPDFTAFTELERVTYGFHYRWSEREGAWYLDLLDAAGAVILAGRKLVPGLPLLGRFVDPRLPPGDLVVFDTTGSDTPPAFGDLGRRVLVQYVESTDLPQSRYQRR